MGRTLPQVILIVSYSGTSVLRLLQQASSKLDVEKAAAEKTTEKKGDDAEDCLADKYPPTEYYPSPSPATPEPDDDGDDPETLPTPISHAPEHIHTPAKKPELPYDGSPDDVTPLLELFPMAAARWREQQQATDLQWDLQRVHMWDLQRVQPDLLHVKAAGKLAIKERQQQQATNKRAAAATDSKLQQQQANKKRPTAASDRNQQQSPTSQNYLCTIRDRVQQMPEHLAAKTAEALQPAAAPCPTYIHNDNAASSNAAEPAASNDLAIEAGIPFAIHGDGTPIQGIGKAAADKKKAAQVAANKKRAATAAATKKANEAKALAAAEQVKQAKQAKQAMLAASEGQDSGECMAALREEQLEERKDRCTH